jgi:hypothetical protein
MAQAMPSGRIEEGKLMKLLDRISPNTFAKVRWTDRLFTEQRPANT